MKKFIYISFHLLFGLSFSQNVNSKTSDSIVWRKVTCESGTEHAKIDFDKGIYNCYSYGLIFDRNPELSAFIRNYTKNKYGIDTKNAGCVITEYSQCYSKTMNDLVLDKFGKDIFEKSRKEAEELFKNEKQ
ncbi:hypothetical protein FLCU109888_06375 [Flavobacterium cucumis]|uniref:Uncharacterized protein n=1 Tax=Flavobacterium cucumis TaxID=416016 RepID=A0A1M7ZW28_9FLAO|nr:hypothetical protein [Flavobacterium cucumis]SHO73091.1 hypothetical protein SAMN05443547_1442 [Flavobacterium cucumis]